MKYKKIEELYPLWDEKIKSGNGTQVYRDILNFPAHYRFKRKERWLFARICRRVGLFKTATRILYPVVRSENKKYSPTPEEIIEYAGSLIQLGCPNEGRLILSQIKSKEHPDLYLFIAFSCFATWDYHSAIPYLKEYLNSSRLTDYQHNIGRVNLFAAYVATDFIQEAYEIYQLLIQNIHPQQNKLLFLNVCEIALQMFIKNKNYQEGLNLIEAHKETFNEVGATYSFYLEKWNSILQYISKTDSAHSRLEHSIRITQEKTILHLKELSQRAQASSYYEIVRDCEKWMGLIKKDPALLTKVYYGTPWPAYKKMISQELRRENLTLLTEFAWPAHKEKQISLQFQRKIHKPLQLILLLLSDLYSPMSFYQIYDSLYENEYFNPITSIEKVKQLILKARRWIKQQRLPFRIQRQKNLFSIQSSKNYYFVLPCKEALLHLGPIAQASNKESSAPSTLPKMDPSLQFFIYQWMSQIQSSMLPPKLSASALATKLRTPSRTIRLWLKKCVELGLVQKSGDFKNTKYELNLDKNIA